MRLLYSVMFFLLTSSTGYCTCEDKNLHTEPDNPLNIIPIYDQGGDGSCYAYAASQLIDYYYLNKDKEKLNKNKNYQFTSALWIAYVHKVVRSKTSMLDKNPRSWFVESSEHRDSLGYSDIMLALNDIQKAKACPSNIVEAALLKFKGTFNDKLSDEHSIQAMSDDNLLYLFSLLYKNSIKMTKKQRVKYLENIGKTLLDDDAITQENGKVFFENFKEIKEQFLKEITADIADEKKKLKIKKFWNEQTRLLELWVSPDRGNQCLPDYMKNFLDILYFRKTNNQVKSQLDILGKNIFDRCSGSNLIDVSEPKFKLHGEGWGSNEKIQGILDKSLAENKPAAIGYCSNIYKNSKSEANEDEQEAKAPVDFSNNKLLPRIVNFGVKHKKCSSHYSLIVGSKKNVGGTCDYMIRNTYGPTFWSPNEKMICTCQDAQNKLFECTKKIHGDQPDIKVLGCWISGDELSKTIFQVVTF